MSAERREEGSDLGARLRKHRLDLDLSLVELGKRSGVSVANISKIETGKITGGFQTIYRLCRGVGILVTDFLEESQPSAGAMRIPRADEAEGQDTRRPFSLRRGRAGSAATG